MTIERDPARATADAAGAAPAREGEAEGRPVPGRFREGRVVYESFSVRRIFAVVRRYWYLLVSSWPRLVELVYWPAVQMLMWGFLQLYLDQTSGFVANLGAVFIGAVLLWDILFRGQLGFSISFLEEMWSRNMGNLMMTPLRPAEFLAALMTMSTIRLLIGFVPVSLMAMVFFDFNVWAFGFALAAFFANLIFTSWAIGMGVSGLVLRNGLGAESLAWSLTFLLLPLACVYYPVEVLPGWLQAISWSLPPTYVFEGMRALVVDGVFRGDLMLQALAMNAVALALGATAFLTLYNGARRAGSLLSMGE